MSLAVQQGAPRPGSWELDADHHTRPMPPFINSGFASLYTESFRRWLRDYGCPLETIECAIVHDFPYMCVRPVGAPPEGGTTPPRFVFFLLSRLHPELRRRNKTAQRCFEEKSWRKEAHEYVTRIHPEARAHCAAIERISPASLSDQELKHHLDQCGELLEVVLRAHFYITGAHMVPVGDYLAQVGRLSGSPPSQLLAALRGCSDASRDTEHELVAAAEALVRAGVTVPPTSAHSRQELGKLTALEGRAGEAVRTWLACAETKNISGHSFTDVTGAEVPEVLLRTLSSAVQRQLKESKWGGEQADTAAARLRERIAPEHRELFDDLLGEARATYGLRDLRCEGTAIGLCKRAIMEAGRRLTAQGKLIEATHALSLTKEQLTSLLSDGGGLALLRGPSPDEAAALHARFWGKTVADVPALLGPPPAPPGDPSAFPAGLRRMTEALLAYLEVMQAGAFSESKRRCGLQAESTHIQGHGASRGIRRGTAKVVRSPADFGRLEEGDILIAPITTPHYNVVLPLLGGVVTDRGGILSHPAIVAREFGIPGVVGTKVATQVIPDGSMVEVDGEAGTVTVLS